MGVETATERANRALIKAAISHIVPLVAVVADLAAYGWARGAPEGGKRRAREIIAAARDKADERRADKGEREGERRGIGLSHFA